MVDDWEKKLIEDLKDPESAAYYGADRAKSNFGLALFHARQNLNITQKQLAEKLNVKQPYIAQLESGEANPTLGVAGRMLASLGLEMVINTEPLAPQEEVTVTAFTTATDVGHDSSKEPKSAEKPELVLAA